MLQDSISVWMSRVLITVSLCLVFVSLSLASIVLAQTQQQCQLARPLIEVIKCDKADAFSKQLTISIDSTSNIASASYTCQVDCTINVQLACGVVSTLKGSVSAGNLQDTINQNILSGGTTFAKTYKIGDGEQFSFTAYCDVPLLGKSPIKIGNAQDSSIQVSDYNKYLYVTNPDSPSQQILSTNNCFPQKLADYLPNQVSSGTVPSVYTQGGIDPLGVSITASNNFKTLSQTDLNSELKVGQTFSYFYRWTTDIPLNLKYDANKNPVYCGGNPSQRKLIGYSKVTTTSGTCYNIPSNVIKNVQCCLDGDCSFTNQICGPDFTCTDKKPCNSAIECGNTQATCSNNVLTSWTCDNSQGPVNLPNGQTYAGWCLKQIKNAACCENSCGPGTHCDYDKGCISNVQLIECPAGKCCNAGGNYRESSCSNGLTCCTTNDPIIGDCKTSCQPIPSAQGNGTAPLQNGGSPFTGFASLINSPSIMSVIAVVIVAVVGIVGYVIWKNRKPEESLSKKESEKEKKDLLGGDV